MATATSTRSKLANYPPDWTIISNRCKARADYTCQSCLQDQYEHPELVLTSHHIDFDPWNNDDDNLVCLCHRCHLRLHGILRHILGTYAYYQKLLALGQQAFPSFEKPSIDLLTLTWRIIRHDIYKPTTE